jgi:membrane protein YqaA with SNARE-associated domain
MFRRLYDWVLHWAWTPYGGPALVVLAFAESSFFPIPPDVLLLPLCLSKPDKSFKFAVLTSIGSVIGGICGYFIGFWLWSLTSAFFFTYIPGFNPDKFQLVQNLFFQYDFWIIFIAGFSPIPYKIFTIGAGVFKVNFFMFFLASAVSRSLRFFLVAGLVYCFGVSIRNFIDKYFNLLTWTFTLLLVGGFLVLKLL